MPGLEVSYQHGVGHVVDAVGSGANVAGILIRPVSIAEIERTAREGLLMPPKSTYFTPKPPDRLRAARPALTLAFSPQDTPLDAV